MGGLAAVHHLSPSLTRTHGRNGPSGRCLREAMPGGNVSDTPGLAHQCGERQPPSLVTSSYRVGVKERGRERRCVGVRSVCAGRVLLDPGLGIQCWLVRPREGGWDGRQSALGRRGFVG